MRKIWQTIGVMALLMTVVGVVGGCSTKKADAQPSANVSKGLDAAAQGKMTQAANYFESAIDKDSKDKQAATYLKQAKRYLAAETLLNDGKPTEAKKKLDAKAVAGGSKVIESQLTALKKTVKTAQKDLDAVTKQVAALKASLEGGDTATAATQATELTQVSWDKKPYLSGLKKQFDTLNAQLATAQSNAASAAASSTAAAEAAQKTQAVEAAEIPPVQPGWSVEYLVYLFKTRRADISAALGIPESELQLNEIEVANSTIRGTINGKYDMYLLRYGNIGRISDATTDYLTFTW